MEKSASLCPDQQNIKLLIRHSIRYDHQEKTSGEQTQLTPEGKFLARRFGKFFSIPITTISSSPIPRCIDTCKEIIIGHGENNSKNELEIIPNKMLQVSHIEDEEKADKTFSNLGISGIFDGFVTENFMPGIYCLKTSVKRIIDYIFETGNKENTIDIFCTHDFQIAMLLLYFFGNTQELKEKLFLTDWPLMLEGIFFWGNKDTFNITWRGKIKNIRI
jgi:hypothetical protein